MPNPLEKLWPLVDLPVPVLAAMDVAKWPKGVHQQLLDYGFLVPADDTDRIVCPECRDHEEEVFVRNGPGGQSRYFIFCPVQMRVEVSPEMRRRWQLNFGCVTAMLSTTLNLTGRCTDLFANRLWRLGRTKWKDTSRDVLFARGLEWNDAIAVRAEIVRARKAVVFVAMGPPPIDFWQRRIPPVLALQEITSLGDTGMEVDVMEITAAMVDADAQAAGERNTVTTFDQLKKMMRQQIKANKKTELTDDAFVAAYRHCGSARAAAKLLSNETGQTITKDKVWRAVERSGGTAEVLNSQDSDSIVRPVASQRRDKNGKPMIQSQTQAEQ